MGIRLHLPTTTSARRKAKSSRATVLVVAVIVAAGVGILLGQSMGRPLASHQAESHQPDRAGTVGAPRGPRTVTNGVPMGYTNDAGGAATAAVNSVQLLVAVTHGRADRDTARASVLATDAEAAVRRVFDTAVSDPADQTTKTPISARVVSQSDTEATIEVWIASTGTTTRADPRSSVEWSTTTVRLVWESVDWKVAALSSRDGPAPGEAPDDSAGPIAQPVVGGLYAFYVT